MPSKSTTEKHGRRYPVAVTAAAEKLGVHRGHLSAVLNGRRESASLTRRYEELVEKQARKKNRKPTAKKIAA